MGKFRLKVAFLTVWGVLEWHLLYSAFLLTLMSTGKSIPWCVGIGIAFLGVIGLVLGIAGWHGFKSGRIRITWRRDEWLSKNTKLWLGAMLLAMLFINAVFLSVLLVSAMYLSKVPGRTTQFLIPKVLAIGDPGGSIVLLLIGLGVILKRQPDQV